VAAHTEVTESETPKENQEAKQHPKEQGAPPHAHSGSANVPYFSQSAQKHRQDSKRQQNACISDSPAKSQERFRRVLQVRYTSHLQNSGGWAENKK
jgi:hypothetical protein